MMITFIPEFQIFFKSFCKVLNGAILNKPSIPFVILGKKHRADLGEDIYDVLFIDLGALLLILIWAVAWTFIMFIGKSKLIVVIISSILSFYPIISNIFDWFTVWRKVKKSFND